MRATQQERLTAETHEERVARLERMRARLTAETHEEKEARLERTRTGQQERLTAETHEERGARQERMGAAQQERLTAETHEERDARLERLRAAQQERLATETAEEREARQQHDWGEPERAPHRRVCCGICVYIYIYMSRTSCRKSLPALILRDLASFVNSKTIYQLFIEKARTAVPP